MTTRGRLASTGEREQTESPMANVDSIAKTDTTIFTSKPRIKMNKGEDNMTDLIFKELDGMIDFYEKRKNFLIEERSGIGAAACDMKIKTIKEVEDVLLKALIDNAIYTG